MRKENQALYQQLRKDYPEFVYEGYHYEVSEDGVSMQFFYSAGADVRFAPKMNLLWGIHGKSPKGNLDGLVFHIGLIELISYWKCVCSPLVRVKPYRLSEAQQQWWKKLYRKGLGEFFYQNTIQPDKEHFLDFVFEEDAADASVLTYPRVPDGDTTLVPIGGGKDSVVTLESLKAAGRRIVPFIINPRGATLDCARIAGFPEPQDIVILQREIDPSLLELNSRGYLNGHTPFSAMLAFYSLLVASCTGIREVALSNESSANEPTIPGTDINHQYSKSLEFEEDFRSYVSLYMNDVAHYYSYLRPLTELQIAERFAQYPAYFKVFKSCNAGSKQNIWCCRCSKCLFAYIILSPFIDKETMVSIFGEDLLDNWDMKTYFDELTGIAEVKPFECVGTVDEVNQALRMVLAQRQDAQLLQYYQKMLNL
ncbi:MAG: hypothetical protein IJU33_07910 [Bacteroidales bacterium]|nr:hypothetical protein [Bacteroidales bacterium]